MMFEIGDLVKCTVTVNHAVFVVSGHAGSDNILVPEGWPVSEHGYAYNPDFCEKYKGAVSVLPVYTQYVFQCFQRIKASHQNFLSLGVDQCDTDAL